MAQFTDFFPQPSTTNREVIAGGYSTVGNAADNTMLTITLDGGGQLTSTIMVGVTVDINANAGTTVTQGRVTAVTQLPGAFTVMLNIPEAIAAGAVVVTVVSTQFEEVIIASDGVLGDVSGDLIGDVYAQNGTSIILQNGTDGTDATFTGNVTGDLTGTADSATTATTATTAGTADRLAAGAFRDTILPNEDPALMGEGQVASWAQANDRGRIPTSKIPDLSIGDVHTITLSNAETSNDNGTPSTADVAAYLNTTDGAADIAPDTTVQEGDVFIATGTANSGGAATPGNTVTFLYTGQGDKTAGLTGGFLASDFHQLASSATSGVQSISEVVGGQINVDNGSTDAMINLALDLAPGNIPMVATGRNALAESTVSEAPAGISISSLAGVGDRNVVVNAAGLLSSVAIEDSVGLYTVQTATDADTSITAYNSIIVLPAITAARTLTIPAADPVVGSSIKISNLSRVPDGAGDFNWTVSFGSQTIMGTTDTTLPLDDGTASFELVYTGATWVIIGAN